MDKYFEEKSKELMQYCREHRIPLFISGYDQTKNRYVNHTVTPTELDMEIPDDKYPDFLRVLTGFDIRNYED